MTETTPFVLAIVNLVFRLVTLALVGAYIIRKHSRQGVGDPRWITLEILAVIAVFILVAGSAFNAGWISLGDWTLYGTWGSIALSVIAFLLLAWRD